MENIDLVQEYFSDFSKKILENRKYSSFHSPTKTIRNIWNGLQSIDEFVETIPQKVRHKGRGVLLQMDDGSGLFDLSEYFGCFPLGHSHPLKIKMDLEVKYGRQDLASNYQNDKFSFYSLPKKIPNELLNLSQQFGRDFSIFENSNQMFYVDLPWVKFFGLPHEEEHSGFDPSFKDAPIVRYILEGPFRKSDPVDTRFAQYPWPEGLFYNTYQILFEKDYWGDKTPIKIFKALLSNGIIAHIYENQVRLNTPYCLQDNQIIAIANIIEETREQLCIS